MVLKSTQKVRIFRWTAQRTIAAQLVAEDELNEQDIAQHVHVTRRALFKWRQHPSFVERVAAIVEETRAKLLADGITIKANRVRLLDERHRALRRVIDERAADPAMRDVPGGTTGLLVAEPTLVRVVEVDVRADGSEILTPTRRWALRYTYRVDVPLLAEIRAIEKQAAIELGQWTEKKEHRMSGSDGPLVAFTMNIGRPGVDFEAFAVGFKELTALRDGEKALVGSSAAVYPEGGADG